MGSLITESSRWRWVFYINLPVGLLAVAALLFFLPATLSVPTSTRIGRAAVRRIDVLGALLSAAATICLMLGLTWGSSQVFAWSSAPVLSMLGGGVLALRPVSAGRAESSEPILPLSLFRNQVFSVAVLLTMLQMMVLLGLSLYLPLFLQGVLALSPTVAGLVITPLSLSMVLGAMLAGPIIGTLKRYQLVIVFGALLMGMGSFLLTLMTPTTSLCAGHRVYDPGGHWPRLVLLPLRDRAKRGASQSSGRQYGGDPLPGTGGSNAGHRDCGNGRQ